MLHNLSIWQDPARNLPGAELKALTDINYLVAKDQSEKKAILDLILDKYSQQARELSYTEIEAIINGEQIPISKDDRILIIRNPEDGQDPSIQKLIPSYLDKFRRNKHFQIFVATNSPFVISAMGELSEYEKSQCDCSKYEFWPSQKVYILKHNQVASKDLELKLDIDNQPKGRYGYWGKKANFIASQMLSSGLFKESLLDERTITADAPILVLCEGFSSEADALIYNQVFGTYRGRATLFISCQGTHELSTAFDIFRQIKNSLSANFALLMLRDRDHEFPTAESIDRYCQSYPDRRVLRRRAIECYLYNSETAAGLIKTLGANIQQSDRQQLDHLSRAIQSEAERGIEGNSYKEELKLAFAEVMRRYKYNVPVDEFTSVHKFSVEVLAKLITPGTAAYKELEQDIFPY